jgi:hypothetical protein
MKARAFVTVVAMSLAVPVVAEAGSLGVRVGAFAPRAEGTLFEDDAELYTFEKNDLNGVTGGVEFAFDVGRRFEIGLHVDGYGREVHTSYRDFVRDTGREIRQTLKLSSVPTGATLRLLLADRDARFVPWVGGGADAVYWRYEEFGDFVDFESPDLDIYDDSFVSEGVTPGLHASAGAWWRVSDDVAVSADARYLFANADMGQDFRGYDLDLNGFAFTVGVQLRLD